MKKGEKHEKILIIIFLSAFICSIFANDVKQSAGPDKSLQSPFKGNGFIYSTTRDAPTYEFVIQPTSIMPTYYDYQPGSYCSLPLRIQPEISQPYGHPAGGAYVAFILRKLQMLPEGCIMHISMQREM